MRIIQTLTRVYTNDLERTTGFYEGLLGTKTGFKLHYAEMNLELAQVGNILILAGDDEALQPFRETQTTLLVDNLDEFLTYLAQYGCEIIREPRQVPTGRNVTLRHPDGMVVEYVEHSAEQ